MDPLTHTKVCALCSDFKQQNLDFVFLAVVHDIVFC
jgi:hypothetical protein